MGLDEEILALCRQMGAGEERDGLLLPLIEAARDSLQRRLKAGVSPRDCGSAFSLAAALTAMDGLDRAAGEGDVSSFTAGEVSIRLQEQSGGGRTEQAERLLAPWLGETGFAFRGVEG